MNAKSLSEIAAVLGLAVPKADPRITGLNTLVEATSSELSFLSSDAYLKELPQTKAAAVLVHRKVHLPELGELSRAAGGGGVKPVVLVVEDADLAVAKVLEMFAPAVPRPGAGVDPTARVDRSATIADGAAVGAFTVVGARSVVGRGTVLHAGVFVGDDVTIGENCEIFPHVTIRERITIGSRVIIHANTVLGTDGFGYRWDGRQHAKIPQIGTVIIEDDVEIGSCVCIDRAKFSATRIGRGTKIDNLVQVAHNVTVGPHCILVGQAGLAGSVHLGTGVVLGGQAAVRDHVTIGDGAMAAACSAVAEDVDPKAVVSGMPALPHRQSLREQAALRHLPELRTLVRKLQEEIEKLKGAKSG